MKNYTTRYTSEGAIVHQEQQLALEPDDAPTVKPDIRRPFRPSGYWVINSSDTLRKSWWIPVLATAETTVWCPPIFFANFSAIRLGTTASLAKSDLAPTTATTLTLSVAALSSACHRARFSNDSIDVKS
eukprot:m.18740 g.18740  ORF g.18740 m.18740 type:complete len:129 (+) comp3624_c0_seq1:88-474(+)